MELLTTGALSECGENEEDKIINEQLKIIDLICECERPAIVKSQRIDLENRKASYTLVSQDSLFEGLSPEYYDCKNGMDIGIEDGLIIAMVHGTGYSRILENDEKIYGMVETKVQLAFIEENSYGMLSKITANLNSLEDVNQVLSGAFEGVIQRKEKDEQLKGLLKILRKERDYQKEINEKKLNSVIKNAKEIQQEQNQHPQKEKNIELEK